MKYKLIIPICITLIKFTVICAQPPRTLNNYVQCQLPKFPIVYQSHIPSLPNFSVILIPGGTHTFIATISLIETRGNGG